MRAALSAVLLVGGVGCGASPTGAGAKDGLIRGAPEDADLWLVPPNICETPVVDHKFRESFEVVASVKQSASSFTGKKSRCEIKIRSNRAVNRRRIRERLYNPKGAVIHEDRWYISAAEGEVFQHEGIAFSEDEGISKFEMVVER